MKKLSRLKLNSATLLNDKEMRGIVGGYGDSYSYSYSYSYGYETGCTATTASEACKNSSAGSTCCTTSKSGGSCKYVPFSGLICWF